MTLGKQKRRGFSLIELVIVVVIIAIIAAIAVPKMSRGASGANEAATRQNVSLFRSAIDLYAAEHGGQYPTAVSPAFGNQLTMYSDISGGTSATKTGAFIYGPYLKAIPTLGVGSNKGKNNVAFTSGGAFAWYYDGTTVTVNNPATETDDAGTPWANY